VFLGDSLPGFCGFPRAFGSFINIEARGSIGIELVETREEEKVRVESDAAVCINYNRRRKLSTD